MARAQRPSKGVISPESRQRARAAGIRAYEEESRRNPGGGSRIFTAMDGRTSAARRALGDARASASRMRRDSTALRTMAGPIKPMRAPSRTARKGR